MDNIRTNLYDKEEIHHNCCVQILYNSVTGESSIGWWPEDNPPLGWEKDKKEGDD